MTCTISTQKRARLAQAPAPAPTMSSVNWASLPFDQVRGVGDCLLADNEIEDYMALRAVCRDWRSATKRNDDDDGDGTDPDDSRLIPTKWALLDRRDDLVTLVNVDTGRFLCKRIPLLLQFFFLGSTSGGLILLEESEEPRRVRVLNPFTGSIIAHFKVTMPCVSVTTVAITTKPPLTVFIYTGFENDEILWADQSMESFKRFSMAFPYYPTCMTSLGGNMYVTGRYGSTYMATAAVGELRRDAAAISPVLNDNAGAFDFFAGPALMSHSRYYLVESAGDLLLVTKPSGFNIDQPAVPVVRRVNMETRVLEQVSSIGSRALFVSHVRCLSINADKLPSIQGGCVYFLEPTRAYYYGVVNTTIVRVADNAVVAFTGGCSLQRFFRPFTLAQVITEYCNSVHSSELYKMMMISWDNRVFDDDSELDDGESSSEDDDDDDDEASPSKPVADD